MKGGLTMSGKRGNWFNSQHYVSLIKSSPEQAKEYIAKFQWTTEVEETVNEIIPVRTQYKEKFWKYPKPWTTKEEMEQALSS